MSATAAAVVWGGGGFCVGGGGVEAWMAGSKAFFSYFGRNDPPPSPVGLGWGFPGCWGCWFQDIEIVYAMCKQDAPKPSAHGNRGTVLSGRED